MNLQQRIFLWLGCVLFSLSNLWPPWAATSRALGGHESFRGFYFVWHDFGWTATHIRPDFSRLILENAVIGGVTLIAVLTVKGQADWRLWAIGKRALSRFSRYQQATLVLTLLSVGVMLVAGANWRLSLGILLLGLTLAWAIGSVNRLLHYVCLIAGLATLVTPACLGWRQHRLAVREFDRSVQEFEVNIPQLAQRYPLSAGCPVAPELQPNDQVNIDPRGPASDKAKASSGITVLGEEDLPVAQAGDKTSSGFPLVLGEVPFIPINNSTELYAVLTQMDYPEGEKDSIKARIAKDLDSKKNGRADLMLPCLSNPESEVDFQISAATGSEFLEFLPPWFMDAVVKGVNVTSVPANEKPSTQPAEFRVLPAFWSMPLVSFLGIVIGSIGGANLARLRRKPSNAPARTP